MTGLIVLPPAAQWQQDALCREVDPELFYPDDTTGAYDTAPAKRVCAACPVRSECLTTALRDGEAYGVWGGLSSQQRKRLSNTPGKAVA